jgi:hypothetical protein
MDRRLHKRYCTDFDVCLTIIQTGELFGPFPVSDMSVSGIGIVLPVQIAPGDTVKLEIGDSTLFGHIVYCNPEGSQFRIGIEVQQVLLGGTELSMLLRRVMGEAMPDVPGLMPSEIHLG